VDANHSGPPAAGPLQPGKLDWGAWPPPGVAGRDSRPAPRDAAGGSLGGKPESVCLARVRQTARKACVLPIPFGFFGFKRTNPRLCHAGFVPRGGPK